VPVYKFDCGRLYAGANTYYAEDRIVDSARHFLFAKFLNCILISFTSGNNYPVLMYCVHLLYFYGIWN